MAFTQTQLDALETAIASGTLRVRYADKEVTYHSISDMLRLRDIMAEELSITPESRTTYATFSRD